MNVIRPRKLGLLNRTQQQFPLAFNDRSDLSFRWIWWSWYVSISAMKFSTPKNDMKHLSSLKPDIMTLRIFLLARSLKIDPEIANEFVFCLEKFTKDQVPWDKIWLERSPWCLVLNNFVYKTKLGRYSHLIFFKISSDFLRQFHSMNLTLSKCFISDRDTYRTIKRNCFQSWWNLEEDPISLDRPVNQLNKLYQIDFLWRS